MCWSWRLCVLYEVTTCALDASHRSHMICMRLSGIHLGECALGQLVSVCIVGISISQKQKFLCLCVHLVYNFQVTL